jgi:hypothetical protein
VEGAIRDAGVEKFDLDDVEQLKRIGRNAGADVVCASSYYEMGGHAMPMHGYNVFMLVWVESTSTVKLNKKYDRAISADYLKSSDTNAFKELVSKADSLLPSR